MISEQALIRRVVEIICQEYKDHDIPNHPEYLGDINISINNHHQGYQHKYEFKFSDFQGNLMIKDSKSYTYKQQEYTTKIYKSQHMNDIFHSTCRCGEILILKLKYIFTDGAKIPVLQDSGVCMDCKSNILIDFEKLLLTIKDNDSKEDV